MTAMVMPTSGWAAFVAKSASVVLDTGTKGVVLVGAALLLTACLHRRSPALRHVLLTGAALGLLLLPVCRTVLPGFAITLATAAPVRKPIAAPEAAPPPARAAGPAANSRLDTAAAPPQQVEQPGGGRTWAPGVILGVWALGATGRSLFVAAGVLLVGRRTRRLLSWPSAEREALSRLVPAAATVRVLRAAPGSIPAMVGILRPTLLLPSEALHWPQDKLKAVLLHELAHRARRDCPAQGAALVASVLHWFNPLVYALLRQLQREREQACDERVVSAGVRPADYASILVEIARDGQSPIPSPAALAMARADGLERRVERLLAPDVGGSRPGRFGTVLLLVLMPVTAVPVGCLSVHRSAPVSLTAEVSPFLLPASPASCRLSLDLQGCSSVPGETLFRAAVFVDGHRFDGAHVRIPTEGLPKTNTVTLRDLRDGEGRPPDLGLGVHTLSAQVSTFRVRVPDGGLRTVRGLRSAPVTFQVVGNLPESVLRPVQVAGAAQLLARQLTATCTVGPLGKASVVLRLADGTNLPFGFCHRVMVRRNADGAEAEAGLVGPGTRGFLVPEGVQSKSHLTLSAYLPLPGKGVGSDCSVRLVPDPARAADNPKVKSYLAEEVTLPTRPGRLAEYPITIAAKLVEHRSGGDDVLAAPRVTTEPDHTAILRLTEERLFPGASHSEEIGFTLEVTPELGDGCIVLRGHGTIADLIEPKPGGRQPANEAGGATPRIEKTTVPFEVAFRGYGPWWRLPFDHQGRKISLELTIL